MKNLLYIFVIAYLFNTCKTQQVTIVQPRKILIKDEFPLNYPNLAVEFYDEIGLLEICFEKIELCAEAFHILQTPEGKFYSEPSTNWKHGNYCLYFQVGGAIDLVTETKESRVVVKRWEKRY
jgi:hypothetical protein